MTVIMSDAIEELPFKARQAYAEDQLYDILYADDTLLLGTCAENVGQFAAIIERIGATYGTPAGGPRYQQRHSIAPAYALPWAVGGGAGKIILRTPERLLRALVPERHKYRRQLGKWAKEERIQIWMRHQDRFDGIGLAAT